MTMFLSLLSRLLVAIAHIRPREYARPRIVRFSCHPWVERGHAKVIAGGRGTDLGRRLAIVLRPALAALFVVVAVAAVLHATGHDPGGALLAFPALALPAELKQKKRKHDELVEHIETALREYEGKAMPQNIADDLDKKAREAEELWKELEPEIKRYETAARLRDRRDRMGRLADAVPDPALPDNGGEKKDERRDQIAGYLPLGEAVVRSPEFQEFIDRGMPRGEFRILVVDELKGSRNARRAFVALTKEQREEWEQKAPPTLGAGVIEPQRIDELVRVTEHEPLMLRDVLNVSQTTSDSITYTRLQSYTRAAAPVAKGAQKPEASMALDTVTVPVKTHAVWIPAHENDLADLPRLANMIDTELLYDLRKLEEEEVLYGDGTGEHFRGILTDPGVQAARTQPNDTLLDIIRRAITDVRRAGYEPNAVVIDPIDWEEIELLKGTDNRYVWAVIRDTLGPRVWSIAVVETPAAEANRGDATEERNLIVGDWMRGATLWVRSAAAISMGWINDQFIRNQRTILAEQRAAFGVKRPLAFRKHQTQAPVAGGGS